MSKKEKPNPLEKFQEMIDDAVTEVMDSIDKPGLRDKEIVRDAVKIRTIRKRLKGISKRLKHLKTPEVKELEKERKDLKDELVELAIALETKIAGDAQILLDEGDEPEKEGDDF